MDRLLEAIDNTQNPSVVGLDPTEALVPPQVVASFADEVRDSVESPEEVESAQLAVAYFEYNRTIIDAIADIVPAGTIVADALPRNTISSPSTTQAHRFHIASLLRCRQPT